MESRRLYCCGNILISVIAIKKAWGFKKANQNFIDKITEAEKYVEEIGVEAAYKEVQEEMGLQIEFDSFDINKEFGLGESEVMPDAETVNN